eukprot:m51a1_g10329 putative C-tail anchored protein (445) ;mRNA; f:91041-92510
MPVSSAATLLALAVALGLAASQDVPTSPLGPVINFTGVWGSWGPWDHCPLGTVAVGMSAKSQHDKEKDTAGMTAIRLYCQAPGDSSPRADLPKGPVSSKGHKGHWDETPTFCPDNYYVAGFVLRWLPDQGPQADNSAVNQIRFFCRDWRGRAWASSALGRTEHGTWNTTLWCPNGTAVAGLSTQLQEEPKGDKGGDDTGLNGVAFECLASRKSCAAIGGPDECADPASNCSWCGSRCAPRGECLQCSGIASRATCLAANASMQCSWCAGSCTDALRCHCAALDYEQCTASGPHCRWCADNCTDTPAQCPHEETVVVTLKFAVGLNASELELLRHEIAEKLRVDPAMVRVVQSEDALAGSGSGSSEAALDISIPGSKVSTLETLVKTPGSSWYLGGLTKHTDRSWGIRKKAAARSAASSAASPASLVGVLPFLLTAVAFLVAPSA